MANKSISQFPSASQVTDSDLLVLEQNGIAKKVNGLTIKNWLIQISEAHGGIVEISKTSESGLTDTYTITFVDNSRTTFNVENGRGISRIEKTSTSGLNDTYTIFYNDGSDQNFYVKNGKSIESIEQTAQKDDENFYTVTYNDGTSDIFSVSNGRGINHIAWTLDGESGNGAYHNATIYYSDYTNSTFSIRDGLRGNDGEASYLHIKYSANEPTSDSDMGDLPEAWIGISKSNSQTDPSNYTDYTWYKIKGDKGDKGDKGGKGDKGDKGLQGLSGDPGSMIWHSNVPPTSISETSAYFNIADLNGPITSGTLPIAGDMVVYGDRYWFVIGSTAMMTVNVGVSYQFVGSAMPAGGLNGQVLTKASDNDYDFKWVTGGGGGSVTVDAALSATSENPVQNKVVKVALDQKADSASLVNKLDKAQGAANAGKFLVVGENGNVTLATLTAWQGGNY